MKPHSRKPHSAERETAEDEVPPNVALDRAMSVARAIVEAKRRRQFGTRRSNLQDMQRGPARYHAEREHLAQERTARQTFVGQPDGRPEPVQGRDRHAQEQAHAEQQVRARSSEHEHLEQAQRSWADHWTPERVRKAQARARELDRQSSEDRIDD